MAGGVLLADSVGKSFGSRRVLAAGRLEARLGEITFVAGRNGAGKSTLLSIAAGWLAADYGMVRFAGRAFQRPYLYQLARLGLFYLPDRGLLSQSRTLRNQVDAVAKRFGKMDAETIAQTFGVAEVLDVAPANFSSGERRRAEVYLAAVRRPICLVADEPIRGIDPKDAEVILRCFRMLADAGCAVVVSGHNTTSLLDNADRVVWLTAGTTHSLGSAAEARAHDQFCREYLTGDWSRRENRADVS